MGRKAVRHDPVRYHVGRHIDALALRQHGRFVDVVRDQARSHSVAILINAILHRLKSAVCPRTGAAF